MKPDELLDDLGRLARAQEEQASAGEVDAHELLRPFDAATHDRIAARVLPLLHAERQRAEAARERLSSSQSRRPPSRRWIVAVIPALAAAAALLWYFWPRADAPLPVYALELHGGVSAERGTAAATAIQVGPGDSVSAVLRPSTAVTGPVAVRIFVDGRALPDASPHIVVEQSAAGALRISGLGPALAELTPGRHLLRFAVGRPGSLPAAAAETPPGSGAASSGVQLLDHEVERPPP